MFFPITSRTFEVLFIHLIVVDETTRLSYTRCSTDVCITIFNVACEKASSISTYIAKLPTYFLNGLKLVVFVSVLSMSHTSNTLAVSLPSPSSSSSSSSIGTDQMQVSMWTTQKNSPSHLRQQQAYRLHLPELLCPLQLWPLGLISWKACELSSLRRVSLHYARHSCGSETSFLFKMRVEKRERRRANNVGKQPLLLYLVPFQRFPSCLDSFSWNYHLIISTSCRKKRDRDLPTLPTL